MTAPFAATTRSADAATHTPVPAFQAETLRQSLLAGRAEQSAEFTQNAVMFASLTADSSEDADGLTRALAALRMYRVRGDRADRPRPGALTRCECDRRLRQRTRSIRPDRRMAEFARAEGIIMTVRVGINGFGRIGRSFARVLLDRQPPGTIEIVAINEPSADPGHSRIPARTRLSCRSSRHRGRGDGTRFARRRAGYCGKRVRPAHRDPVVGPRRRSCCRGEWAFPIARSRRRPPRGGCASSRHLCARPGCRPYGLHRGERRRLRPHGPHRGVECVVHDELPRADGSRPRRTLRHHAGIHDDRACLHQ